MSIFSQVGHSRLFGKHKEALDLFSAGKTREAILMLLDLAEAEPTNALVCIDIGRTVMAMGLPDQAVVAARQALELDETNTEALMLLASALEKSGKPEEGLVVLRRVIELQNDPQRTIEDIENEKVLHPLTVPEYGVVFLSFSMLGDCTNLTLKSCTSDKAKSELIYITIAGEGTEDKHDGYTEIFAGSFTRERLLKSLPDDIAATVGLFPGENFAFRLFCVHGVTEVKREKEVVVSMSVDPSRIDLVVKTADMLLRQVTKPDHLVMWISEDADTGLNRDNEPESFRMLARRGLEIRWCADTGNLRTYAEARKAFPDALVVTTDLNVLYSRGWLDQLLNAHKKEPEFIHCHCAHQILYAPDGRPLPFKEWNHLARNEQGPDDSIYPVTCAGAIYAPGHVADEALDAVAFSECAEGNLDVWLKAMSLKNGTKCKKVFLKSLDVNKVRQAEELMADASAADVCIDEHVATLAARYNVFNRKA